MERTALPGSSKCLHSCRRQEIAWLLAAEGCCQGPEKGRAMLKLLKGIAYITLIVLLFPFLVLGFLVGK